MSPIRQHHHIVQQFERSTPLSRRVCVPLSHKTMDHVCARAWATAYFSPCKSSPLITSATARCVAWLILSPMRVRQCSRFPRRSPVVTEGLCKPAERGSPRRVFDVHSLRIRGTTWAERCVYCVSPALTVATSAATVSFRMTYHLPRPPSARGR
jgi:hypothetical protein